MSSESSSSFSSFCELSPPPFSPFCELTKVLSEAGLSAVSETTEPGEEVTGRLFWNRKARNALMFLDTISVRSTKFTILHQKFCSTGAFFTMSENFKKEGQFSLFSFAIKLNLLFCSHFERNKFKYSVTQPQRRNLFHLSCHR